VPELSPFSTCNFHWPPQVGVMRVLLNLALCLVATMVIASGTAAILFVVAQTTPKKVPVQQKTQIVGPRVQAWLDRKAEEQAYAEKEKAAALAEKERTEALRVEIPPPIEHTAVAQARNAEQNQAARLERARRARRAAKQEERRRLRLQHAEIQGAYGYAPDRRWSFFPDEFLTRRDRYGD